METQLKFKSKLLIVKAQIQNMDKLNGIEFKFNN